MATTESWAWYPGTTWPKYSSSDQDNLDSVGNGMSVPPTYETITWNDTSGDGTISDADTDDGGAKGETVTIDGVEHTVQEVVPYTGSTMVVNGVPQTVTVTVWVFTDGTYITRINDADIPPGVHYSEVDSVTLGKASSTEYSGSYIATRDDPFVCFTAGTLIATPGQDVAIDRLRVGDLVLTADHGPQPLRWIGRRRVPGHGAMAPVAIAAGALGNRRALRVSQQHRMLVGGWRAQLFAGEDEVLVAAHHLVNGRTIRLAPCPWVTYVHLLLDGHEILLAEGCPSESLHPGDMALDRMGQAARDEVLALFPGLAHQPAGPLARRALPAWEARCLAPG